MEQVLIMKHRLLLTLVHLTAVLPPQLVSQTEAGVTQALRAQLVC